MELKGSVFKKFEKNNLFQMACSGMLKYGRYFLRIFSLLVERTLVKFLLSFADIRERFHYLILVTIVTLRNLTEFNWNLGKSKE